MKRQEFSRGDGGSINGNPKLCPMQSVVLSAVLELFADASAHADTEVDGIHGQITTIEQLMQIAL
jgi:hypothetical protein